LEASNNSLSEGIPSCGSPQRGFSRIGLAKAEKEEMSHVEVGSKGLDEVERAILERPNFSIRFNIIASFLICFVLALVSNMILLTTLRKMESRLYFLEVAQQYLFEIQQARRFEKNYFLYGTNLEDALEHVESAKALLLKNADKLIKVTNRTTFQTKLDQVQHYENLLRGLLRMKGAGGSPEVLVDPKYEEEIRKFGASMVVFAQTLLSKEQQLLDSMLLKIQRIPLYFLAILFLFLVYIAFFLIKRIVGPIGRFQAYTQRIASGDFTPITPVRRYKDEFSNLAIAINNMMMELNRRQQILVESHKLRAVGTLTAGIAHELNNPINNITLTAYSLLEEYEELSDEQRLELIQDLIHEADRSQKIVRNLLDFARESESKMEPLDLADILNETVRFMENQIRLAGVELRLSIEPHLPRIHGDRQQLGQVFLNLIMNALDAMENVDRKGILEIEVRRSGQPRFIEVRFIDNGEGIPEHTLSNIFDPFFTTKETGKGAGLGLSVSQGIIAKHGGRIEVRSVLGKGSTFTVLLPVTTIPAHIEEIKSLENEGSKEAVGTS
jgi:signal transduction histidine kinase